MIIEKFEINKDGDTEFFVNTEDYESIQNHLAKKGIHTGGDHSEDSDFSFIVTTSSIQSVNEALQDYDK